MFSDIKTSPDLFQRVRYSITKQEDKAEWEKKKVYIYNYINDGMDGFQLEEGDQRVHSPPAANKSPARSGRLCKMVLWVSILGVIITLAIYFSLEIIKVKKSNSHLQAKLLDQQVHSPPAANKSPDRSVKLCKMVLWILMLAVIITLAIYLPLEIIKVKKSNSHLQAKLLANNSQLQAKSLDMAEKIGQLQATYLDMAANNTQLKAKLVVIAAKNSQLQESYEILRKTHSQLTDEVNILKDQVKGKWCPDGWTRFGSSCYCKFKETKLWTESRKHCQDRGADLVIIDSPDEQVLGRRMAKVYQL
ncbi:uncharacterized protein V3H82_019887 isoform 2-T2 [Fundulus diaphanus]